ncbi:MAG TPA: hypothetical protein ENK44_02420 [Caldithrix abyssi]|uniref:Uncharacterized protein n=1 Tax=Caldithrix abyssi TaxID=187145 RepID=A0A7V4TY20_CALAY|nr:hypothetical protein [Caldithrix abyssi]
MEQQQKQKLIEMAPILVFIAVFFITNFFDWMDVSKFIWAMLAGTATFFVMAADFKEGLKEKKNLKDLDVYVAVLTGLFILFFLHGFLHWYRVLSIFLRNGLMFVLLLIYFIVMFRAIRVLAQYKSIFNHSGR